MAVLLGQSEERIIYDNFRLENLNSNNVDFTHTCYEEYLKNHKFITPFERGYFVHSTSNVLPTPPDNREKNRGAFNVFPLDLSALKYKPQNSTNLGKTSRLDFFSRPIFLI